MKATADKNAAVAQAEKTSRKAQLADRLINGLSGENTRWNSEIKRMESVEGRLVGDVLVAAAFVSYAGEERRDTGTRVRVCVCRHVPASAHGRHAHDDGGPAVLCPLGPLLGNAPWVCLCVCMFAGPFNVHLRQQLVQRLPDLRCACLCARLQAPSTCTSGSSWCTRSGCPTSSSEPSPCLRCAPLAAAKACGSWQAGREGHWRTGRGCAQVCACVYVCVLEGWSVRQTCIAR